MKPLDALHHDIVLNWEALSRDDSQLNRRNYIRSLFAFYEVALSNLRETAAQRMLRRFEAAGEWDIHSLSALLDERPKLSGSGKISLEPNRLPFLPLVAHVLKTLSDLSDTDRNVLSDHRWGDFKASVEIRHRITHPKLYSDVEVTDEELRILESGRTWWNATLTQF